MKAGVGIGPPSADTRPNGLDVVGADGVRVELLSPSGAAVATVALPRMVLGPFTFALNPRDSLALTEPPVLAKHAPPGGTPRYQFMGRDETKLSFRGKLSGDDALARMAALRALNGTRQPFSYGALSAAQAWVRVDWTFNRDDDLDYTIQLVVEADLALNPAAAGASTRGSAQAEGQAATPDPSGGDAPTVAYTVKTGDTLWGIAQAKYGDGGLFPVIARLNDIHDPRTLEVGSTLQLPADRAAARALKAKQDAALAALPSDSGVGLPAAASGLRGAA